MLRKSLGNFPNLSSGGTDSPSIRSRGSQRVSSAQARRGSTRLSARSSDEMSGRIATPAAPVIRNSVILQQAKIKNYSDFILYFLQEEQKNPTKNRDEEVHQESHTFDEPISIKKVEEIIVESSALYEKTFHDQTAVQVMDEYVSMLKAIHMSYSEWFDFVSIRCKRRDALTRDEFQREVIRLCQDLRRPPMEAPNILILFQYIYGNYHPHHHQHHHHTHAPPEPGKEPAAAQAPGPAPTDTNTTTTTATAPAEELLEKEHFDVAFEKFQLTQSWTRKLTVAASQMRSLGSYMKQNDINLLDLARKVDDLPILDNDCIATSQLDVLLSSLVASYDAFVYEHGTPVDLIESIAANFGGINASGGAGVIGGVNANGGGGRRRRSRTGLAPEGGPDDQLFAHPEDHPGGGGGGGTVIHGHPPPLHRMLSEDMDESPAEMRLLMKHKSQLQHQNSFKLGDVAALPTHAVSNVMHTLGNMASTISKQFTFQNQTTVVPTNEQTGQQQQQPVVVKKKPKDDLIDLQANNEYIKHLNMEEQLQFMRLVDPHHQHHNYDEVESHFQTNITRRRASHEEEPSHDPHQQSVQSVAARYSVAHHPHPTTAGGHNGTGTGSGTHYGPNGELILDAGYADHHPTSIQRENTEQQELRFYQNYYNSQTVEQETESNGSLRHYIRQQPILEGVEGVGGGDGQGQGEGVLPTTGAAAGVGAVDAPSQRRRQSVGGIPSTIVGAGNTANGGIGGTSDRPMSSSAAPGGSRRGSVTKPPAENAQFRGLLDSFNARLGSAKSAMVKNR